MCGIFFALFKCKASELNLNDINFDLLKNRGPDSFHLIQIEVNEFTLVAAVSVLSLRGGGSAQITKQPLIDSKSNNILLWNGELFGSDLIQVDQNENDGFKILQKLSDNYELKTKKDILKLLESIKGPFAFVFYEHKTSMLYFGRDRLGRRSLLINSAPNELILSSVQVENNFNSEFIELKASAFYSLDLNEQLNLQIHLWKRANEANNSTIEQFPYSIDLSISDLYLNDSISELNQSFNILKDELRFQQLVDDFFIKLKESVSRRVKNLPNFCKQCSKQLHLKFNDQINPVKCEHAKLAVLFSGGVDSTVLAALADLCLPMDEPIDLLNIAFEKQKKNNDLNEDFLVPDRISGLESLKELNPKRKWNFVEINVTLDELRVERDRVIKHLLYPHATVLDDSIGCALWFASRGLGQLKTNDQMISYQSNAEVLLLGMGADEQLAGYARHRTKFEKEGFEALINEIQMEMKRISERNLGRDDRILSDHGKESRLPFLDEDLICFLNEIEIEYKCDMKLERGFGEKYLLRQLAANKLGLKFSAQLQKRAIQFGSRVAKIENMKEKASDKCNRIAKNFIE